MSNVIQRHQPPMGVVTYKNIKIKDALPSQKQLAEPMRLLQKKLHKQTY